MGQLGKHFTRGKAKIAYTSWVEALKHATMHAKDQKAIVSIYECKQGPHFHIGKSKLTNSKEAIKDE